MSNNDEIVRLAALMCKANLSDEEMSEYDRGLAQLNGDDFALVHIVGKLLEGKPYGVSIDNPKSVLDRRHRALAQHVGASVEEIEQGDGLTRIVYRPPSRQ
jgi:hypothetical protein